MSSNLLNYILSICQDPLLLHQKLQPALNLIKDIVWLPAVGYSVKYVRGYFFVKKCNELENDLKMRKKIESHLQKHVDEEYKNGIRDIGIRLVFLKNYRSNLYDDDGYKICLSLRSYENDFYPSGFISKTGINFIEHIWFSASSVYVDQQTGIFFVDKKNQKYKGFSEYPGNNILQYQLLYKNIINCDFKEQIEYEPVFYTRYKYNDIKNYNDTIFLENLDIKSDQDAPYYHIELKQGNDAKRYHSIKHFYLIAKIRLTQYIKRLRNLTKCKL